MKEQRRKISELNDREADHGAARASELTMDYVTYLEDYAKLNGIDEADFLLYNLLAFPSTVLAHLSIRHDFHMSYEAYIQCLVEAYGLSDGKGKHHPLDATLLGLALKGGGNANDATMEGWGKGGTS